MINKQKHCLKSYYEEFKMENKLQRLPLGRQSFEILRENKYLYVDKTKDILKLIESGDIYFLSRPRRFGKSLLVSTLEELFKGREELFKDLYIYDKWDWNKKYPVISLSMDEIENKTNDKLETDLLVMIENIAKKNNIKLNEKGSYVVKFSQLIEELSYANGSKVVVLIDEYDKPITDNIDDFALADDNRKTLRKFYGTLKNADKYIKFIFITGISKFSKTSIFSGLNNTTDISLDDNYSTICGYTKYELKNYFNDYLNKCSEINNKESIESLIEEIDNWYDGYSWDGRNFVYNPWSVLNLFRTNIFDNYWFESGTPSFLIKIIEKYGTIEEKLLKPQTVSASAFSNFKLKNLNLTATLMQTGYLTIKKRIEFDGRYEYTLDIPNKEVKESLFTYILSLYTGYDIEEIITIINKMRKQLKNLDSIGFNDSVNELLTEIHSILHQNADDFYYQSVFIAWFIGLGFKIDSEVSTNIGIVDSVIEIDDFIVICEIKHDNKDSHDKLIKEALDQIKNKEYYRKYLKRNKKIIFLAIAFNNKKAKTVIEEL
jgi:hypothetical protein